MFEDCEAVDTITVETIRQETIYKHLEKNSMHGQKQRYRFSSCWRYIVSWRLDLKDELEEILSIVKFYTLKAARAFIS